MREAQESQNKQKFNGRREMNDNEAAWDDTQHAARQAKAAMEVRVVVATADEVMYGGFSEWCI